MIIIKEEFNELWLYSITHMPINLTPFTDPNSIGDFSYSYRVGKLKKLFKFQLETEYNLDCYKDFEVIERERKPFNKGSFYDELTLIPKTYLRKYKLEKLDETVL